MRVYKNSVLFLQLSLSIKLFQNKNFKVIENCLQVILDQYKQRRGISWWPALLTDSVDNNLSTLLEIAEDREAGTLQSMESQKVAYDLATEQQQQTNQTF